MNRSVAVLIAIIGVSLGACCFGSRQEPAAPAPSPVDVQPSQGEPITERAAGNVSVTIAGGSIGPAKMFDKIRNEETTSEKTTLKIVVWIKNNHPNKIVNYTPWGGKQFARPGELGRIRDEFGNTYSNFRPAFGLEFRAQLTSITRVDPGSKVEDIVVFDAPIAKAKDLTLTLPVRNLGQSGPDMQFTLPRSFFD